MNSNSVGAASRTIVGTRADLRPYVPDVEPVEQRHDDLRRQAVPLLVPDDPGARAAPAPAGERQVGGVASVPRRPAARGARRRDRWRRRSRSWSRARSCGRCAAWPTRAMRSPPARPRRRCPRRAPASSPRSRRRSTRWRRSSPTSRESERNFLLSVSHELKTPLTAIRGYAEGLGEGAFTRRGGVGDDPGRGAPARAARARPARPRADEPARVLGLARARRPRRGRARRRSRGTRRRRASSASRSRRRATSRGSRATTTGCSRSPRTSSRTPCARRRPAARSRCDRSRGAWSSPTPGPGLEPDDLAARLRPLLPLRQVRPRAPRRQRPRPRDREAAHRGDGRDASTVESSPGAGATFASRCVGCAARGV